MRRLAAALLAVAVLALAGAPHDHAGPRGADGCAACLVRSSEPARSAPADVAPRLVGLLEVVVAPVVAPPAGAPLGAVPGQSPPAAA